MERVNIRLIYVPKLRHITYMENYSTKKEKIKIIFISGVVLH